MTTFNTKPFRLETLKESAPADYARVINLLAQSATADFLVYSSPAPPDAPVLFAMVVTRKHRCYALPIAATVSSVPSANDMDGIVRAIASAIVEDSDHTPSLPATYRAITHAVLSLAAVLHNNPRVIVAAPFRVVDGEPARKTADSPSMN